MGGTGPAHALNWQKIPFCGLNPWSVVLGHGSFWKLSAPGGALWEVATPHHHNLGEQRPPGGMAILKAGIGESPTPEFAWCALPSSDGPCSPAPGHMEPGNRKVLETPWNPGFPGMWAGVRGVLVVVVEEQEGPQLCTHSGAPS